jgi:hypothetical protein
LYYGIIKFALSDDFDCSALDLDLALDYLKQDALKQTESPLKDSKCDKEDSKHKQCDLSSKTSAPVDLCEEIVKLINSYITDEIKND